jgi:hypothetical protein
MADHFGTVDADGHLEENHIDWKKRLPDKYKSQAPSAATAATDNCARSSKAGLAQTGRSRPVSAARSRPHLGAAPA